MNYYTEWSHVIIKCQCGLQKLPNRAENATDVVGDLFSYLLALDFIFVIHLQTIQTKHKTSGWRSRDTQREPQQKNVKMCAKQSKKVNI